MELLPTKIGQRTLDQAKPALEDSLRASLGADGFLSDLVECSLASVSHPAAITPFSAFAYKLYKSEAATSAIRALLTCSLPGTTDSFDTVLSAEVVAIRATQNNNTAGTNREQRTLCAATAP